IRDILSPRVPKFLLFDDDHRALSTEYVWEDHPEPTHALENLFALAKTDYQQFRGHAQVDDRPTMETMLEAANRALDEAFKAWRQADLHVTFSADHRALHLLVRDRATAKRTRLDERSAGLRSFVALIAFCARFAVGVRPVLMVDEAEMHLHYGGQADLVRVFERQQVAETIIYTTHSVGCLPSDLGATIRVVGPVNGDPYRSRIHNSFWAAHAGAGLTPIMLAMGADAFAFTPSRRAVIGEGASEAILLPSLVREAQSAEQRDEPLGYQVAPGIAEVAPDDAEALELEAAGVAYLLDCDDGGRGHRRKLSERAKGEGRVVNIGQPGSEEALCIEDFVCTEVLTNALNRLLGRRAGWCGDTLAAEELPANARASHLHTWCKDRDIDIRKLKAQLAAEALDIGRERGLLLEPARTEQLRRLHEQLLQATETTAAQPAETQQDPG
ncbi:MAG TPA: AAA family ATPase, partial [Solirubrobacteraceae bacterium]